MSIIPNIKKKSITFESCMSYTKYKYKIQTSLTSLEICQISQFICSHGKTKLHIYV